MAKITALFWDVGGVILTNGWDRSERRRLAQKFKLDWDEFEDRHELVVTRFETGRMTLDRYLERTVFHAPREFKPDEVKQFMFAQSERMPGTLELVARLAKTGRYLLATLNNESRELNLYRIEHFGLKQYFSAFLSSCFLHVMKPDDEIYRLALDLTQRCAEESVFIDDRELNAQCARQAGMKAIRFKSAQQIEHELRANGVEV
jgi:putative hydrolase of the HAD superfamily